MFMSLTLKWLPGVLFIPAMLAGFFYAFWGYGPRLEAEFQLRRLELDQLAERKQTLLTEVYLLRREIEDLKAGGEEGVIHAQTQLGLLRAGERLYRFTDGEQRP
jgi:cell division protein FtsB